MTSVSPPATSMMDELTQLLQDAAQTTSESVSPALLRGAADIKTCCVNHVYSSKDPIVYCHRLPGFDVEEYPKRCGNEPVKAATDQGSFTP